MASTTPASRLPTNIGADPTSFIGRSRDLAELGRLLSGDARLVTVLGPGGIGKTRLARRLAVLALAEQRFEAAWFCDLSDTRSQESVVAAVAAAAGLSLPATATPATQSELLGQLLARRGPTLWVLDNCEQLEEIAARCLADWLAAAPQARFLATSRVRLRVAGETTYELSPLALEAAEGHSDAGRLFVERARAARPAWRPGGEDASTIDEIVARLDGIPLAIELAAARMSLLSPGQILDRLPRRFDLLRGDGRDVSPRQATLQGAIDWSWQLLEAHEQRALAQCGVFRGGFTVDAVEAVLSLGTDAPDVLDVVQSLRDQSLVRTLGAEAGTPLRLGLYESIRAYAAARLVESGDQDATLTRHARHVLGAGEDRLVRVESHGGLEARRALTAERENVLAVIDRSLDGALPLSDGLRGVLLLDPILSARGPYCIYLELLERAVAAAEAGSHPLLPHVVAARGHLQRLRGCLAESEEDLGRARDLARVAGDPRLEARTTATMGIVAHLQGRLDDAGALHEEALSLARAIRDRNVEARALGSLAILHHEQGRADDAQVHFEWALALARTTGDRRSEGVLLSNLGDLHHEAGRPREARDHYRRARDIVHALGDRRVEGVVLGNLGAVAQEQGDLDAAVEHRAQAVDILQDVGDQRMEGVFRGYLGAALHERGELEAAAAAYERAIALVRDAGTPRYEGLFSAYRGALLSAQEQADRARPVFAHARTLLDGLAEPLLLDALAVHEAHLDLARSADVLASAAAPAARSDEVRFAVRLLERALGREAARSADPAAGPPLRVGPDGRRVALPDGEALDLSRRRSLRLIVDRLADERLDEAGRGLSLDDLFEAGWPGERVHPESGANRVYVAVATLRKLGLRGVLLSRDDGYLLDPAVPLVRDASLV